MAAGGNGYKANISIKTLYTAAQATMIGFLPKRSEMAGIAIMPMKPPKPQPEMMIPTVSSSSPTTFVR
ncbi:Uncharacterised protein [Pseudomonas putida]|nr:Uncharacterised protein [Pseudomonas putida]